MGRKPCYPKEEVITNRGYWTAEEDSILSAYVKIHGPGKWRSLPKKSGLKRCGKSCRLRWLNYLRPDIKRGNITDDEEDLIIRLHKLLGNRWSLIAGRLPGRTDNEIKNYWNTHLQKKLQAAEQRTILMTAAEEPVLLFSTIPEPAAKEAIAPESEKDENWWREILTSMNGYQEISKLECQDFKEDWSYNSMTNLLNCEDCCLI